MSALGGGGAFPWLKEKKIYELMWKCTILFKLAQGYVNSSTLSLALDDKYRNFIAWKNWHFYAIIHPIACINYIFCVCPLNDNNLMVNQAGAS